MKRHVIRLFSSTAAVVGAASLLAGCGGGSSSPATPEKAPVSTPTSAAVPTEKLIITFPIGTRTSSAHARTPKYVSPNTTSFETIVNSINGNPPPAGSYTDTTTALVFAPASGSNCTVSGGDATCTITIPAPPGSVNYTFNAKDAGNHVLASLTTTLTNTVGQNNTASVTLNGVVATVTMTVPALTANTSESGATVTWSALDASGAQIVGSASFVHPITVTDNDATGQTQLHVNNGTGSTTVTLTKPTDTLTLDYTGQADNPFTIGWSGTGITSGTASTTPTVFDVTFTGTPLDDAAHGGLSGDLNWSEPTLFFLQPSGSQNVTGAEAGWTNAPYSQQFTLDTGPSTAPWCAFYGSSIATFSASPATTFTVTAKGIGVCKARLEESGTGYPITTHPAPSSSTDTTHDGTFWVSVTESDVTVDGKHRQLPHGH